VYLFIYLYAQVVKCRFFAQANAFLAPLA